MPIGYVSFYGCIYYVNVLNNIGLFVDSDLSLIGRNDLRN